VTISLPAAGATLPSPEHLVQFYETDEFLADAVARFVRVGLERGDPVLVVATSAHRAAVLEVLRRMDVDVDAAARDGMLVLLDATTAAETIVVDGRPDPARFEAFVAQPLRALAGRSGRPVRVYGEIVDVLWRDGRRAAALALEEMWNALQTRERFSLLCAYLMNSFLRHSGIPEVCAVHGHVHAPEGSSPTISIAEPTADVRALIQEVAFRRELEGALRDTVSQLEAVTAQLRTATSELQDFLDAAPVPIHRVAGSGTILWANAAELELLGYHYDEYVGHPIAKFHADKALIETILERLSRGETLRDVEATVIAKDGSLRHVQISTNARVHDGQLIATRCFTRDRTALRHAERRAAILHRLSLALSPTLGADEAARIVLDELTAIIPDARCSLTLVDAERGAPVAAGTTVFPIAFDDHPLAVITITPPQDRPLSPAERDLLDGIRRECAQALERARLHDGMVAARADAVAANRAKDEFLAMLGHELRNPLSPTAATAATASSASSTARSSISPASSMTCSTSPGSPGASCRSRSAWSRSRRSCAARSRSSRRSARARSRSWWCRSPTPPSGSTPTRPGCARCSRTC
jgi:PAS domain S-box-containing protein